MGGRHCTESRRIQLWSSPPRRSEEEERKALLRPDPWPPRRHRRPPDRADVAEIHGFPVSLSAEGVHRRWVLQLTRRSSGCPTSYASPCRRRPRTTSLSTAFWSVSTSGSSCSSPAAGVLTLVRCLAEGVLVEVVLVVNFISNPSTGVPAPGLECPICFLELIFTRNRSLNCL